MKKLLALACAVSAVALTSGASANETGALTLTGNVAQSMVLTYAGHSGDGTISGTGIDKTITLATFSTNGQTNVKAGGNTYGVVSNVNFSASVTSQKGGLKIGTTGADVVTYTVGVGATPPVEASTITSTGTSADYGSSPSSQTVPVAYAIAGSQAVPVAGDYSDVLTLTIAPR